MSHPELVENVAAGLSRRGLPSEYVERVQTELADHYADLVEDSVDAAEAAERLGDERRLTKRFVREYQRRSFAGRFPLVTFLLGTPAALILSWVVVMLTVQVVVENFLGGAGTTVDGHLSWLEWATLRIQVGIFLIVLPSLVAVWFTRQARRSGLGWQWAALTCVLMAFAAGFFQLRIDYDHCMAFISTPQLDSSWLPMPVEWLKHYLTTPAQLVQWLPPVLLGALAFRQAREQPTAATC
ncbi:MAG: hypothetical protein AAGA92_09700 [Planctomycetota bacterium]